MENKKFVSTAEMAKRLGVSRVTIFNKIKSGEIKAQKVGRNYVIEIDENVFGNNGASDLEAAVGKVVNDYGETLRLLGQE